MFIVNEMENNFFGVVDKYMKWEEMVVDKVDEWKNIFLCFFIGGDIDNVGEVDCVNIECIWLKGSGFEFLMDGVQIVCWVYFYG